MRITAKNGSVFNVSEGGIINSGMYYHDVYKYFGYIIDPRYGQVVSKFSYMNVLKAINNGAKFILSIL